MRALLLWSSVWVLVIAAAPQRAEAEVPIVYSRCPRGNKPFEVTGPLTKNGTTTMATVTVTNGDLLEALPDTARMTSNFVAPCDLVYRDGGGNERILYSCIAESTPTNACAALDAAVSFDAKTIAFSVFRGPLTRWRGTANGKVFDPDAENTNYFFADLPGSYISPTEAQIVLVDVASGKQTPLPFPPGTINFGPAWLSDGRIAFSAQGRRDIYGPMPLCNNSSGLSIQLYATDPDGRNVELVSPHALAAELHPLQLTDGRVAISSWQEFGALAFRHGNGFGGCGTLPNFFHIYAQNPDGASATALYGQHLSDPTYVEYPNFSAEMAAHFLGQTSDGRVWTAEYYRANNLGLGSIQGFPMPPVGQEGPSVPEAAAMKTSAYRAPGEVRLAPWASNGDQYAIKMPAPPLMLPGYVSPIAYAGKLGHPSGLPGNQLMVTWGVGPCSQVTGSLDILAMQKLATVFGDNPACDTGIYRTPPLDNTPNQVKHPSQLVQIVNSPDYHEFLARAVVPYKDIYGIDAPPVIPRAELTGDAALTAGTPFGVLGASSIIHRETHPDGPILFSSSEVQSAHVGTDTIEYGDEELCGVRILAIHSNRKVESTWKSTSTVGERVAIIGEFTVRNFDSDGKPILDAMGNPDTSFKVRFPADAPYLMQGIDCQGRTLNTDLTWQSLRPGEVKTCNGCHVHSAAATKLPFADSLAAKGNTTTHLLGGGKVPLLTGGSGPNVTQKEVDGFGYMISFEKDVMPIFQARCVSCHGGITPAAGLALDIPRDWTKVKASKDDSTYYRLALDSIQKYVPAALQYKSAGNGTVLAKPNTSKYVRMMNSRGSLLYWKAKNARTDNHTDADRTDDVDFGPDHPTTMTADELGILSRWIDTGAGDGPELDQDKIFPSLHVVGEAADNTVTALHIGTVDVGSGIDPSSLTACVIASPGGSCGPNLAGKAALADITTVMLSPALSDPDAEVVVTVKDVAGNLTEVRRTVRFLLALPPPPVIGGGPGDRKGGMSGGDLGCSCDVSSRASAPWVPGLAALLALAWFSARARRAEGPRRRQY